MLTSCKQQTVNNWDEQENCLISKIIWETTNTSEENLSQTLKIEFWYTYDNTTVKELKISQEQIQTFQWKTGSTGKKEFHISKQEDIEANKEIKSLVEIFSKGSLYESSNSWSRNLINKYEEKIKIPSKNALEPNIFEEVYPVKNGILDGSWAPFAMQLLVDYDLNSDNNIVSSTTTYKMPNNEILSELKQQFEYSCERGNKAVKHLATTEKDSNKNLPSPFYCKNCLPLSEILKSTSQNKELKSVIEELKSMESDENKAWSFIKENIWVVKNFTDFQYLLKTFLGGSNESLDNFFWEYISEYTSKNDKDLDILNQILFVYDESWSTPDIKEKIANGFFYEGFWHYFTWPLHPSAINILKSYIEKSNNFNGEDPFTIKFIKMLHDVDTKESLDLLIFSIKKADPRLLWGIVRLIWETESEENYQYIIDIALDEQSLYQFPVRKGAIAALKNYWYNRKSILVLRKLQKSDDKDISGAAAQILSYIIRVEDAAKEKAQKEKETIPAVMAPTISENRVCHDTDGWKNLSEQWTVTIENHTGYLTDYCSVESEDGWNYTEIDSCDWKSCFLREAHCDAPKQPSYTLFPSDMIPCPKGCSFGTCKT